MFKTILILLFPIIAFANIGRVSAVKGDVQLTRAEDIIKIKTGTILEKHDFIETAKNSKVQIIFTDNTIFTVGKNSTLDIADYLYDEAKPKKNRARFNVLKGAFSSITGRIGKLNKSKFRLKTKSASIGIRGTIVKANQEMVMCTQGAITVTTPSGATVRVEAGQKTNVASGTPTVPTKITKQDKESLDVDVKNTANKNNLTAINDMAIPTEIKSTDLEPNTNYAIENEESVSKTTDFKMVGRSINSDGDQQLLTIEGVSDGDIDLSSQGLIEEDTDAFSDIITWGHWENTPTTKWVAGYQTPINILNDLRNNIEQETHAQYNGKVIGNVNGVDNIKTDSNNIVRINFVLGAGKNSMDGIIRFDTESGQSWNSSFSGSTSNNAFSASSIAGSVTTPNTATAITSGNVDGNFYGAEAEAVGGTFKLGTESDTATGVFKATK